jgi:hypothetical protein
MKSYPSVRYNSKNETVLVLNDEELQSLGDEWADTPAAFGFIESPDPDENKEEPKIVLEDSPVKHKKIKKPNEGKE